MFSAAFFVLPELKLH